MVRAILDGRKTVTRRVIRYKYSNTEMKMRTDKYGTRLIEIQKDIKGETYGKNPDGSTWHKLLPYIERNPPYKKWDILYVRETFQKFPRYRIGEYPTQGNSDRKPAGWDYVYKTDNWNPDEKWIPSIHMPKEAARIWLRVTDVRVERLQEIDGNGCIAEGIELEALNEVGEEFVKGIFHDIWDSTIKKPDLDLYGWDANPWIWVIDFDRCERPEVI